MFDKANAIPGAALGEPVVTMRDQFPPPIDQGLKLQSCTAFAVAYAVDTYLNKKQFGWTDFDGQHAFSPSFIYNQYANNHGRRGILILQALNLLESGGCVTLATMPYDPEDADTAPTEDMIKEARGSKLRVRDDPLPVFDVATVKSYLVSQIPCVVGANVDVENNGLWKINAQGVTDGYLHTGDLGSHCMVVIGYDDTKRAFEVLNSWGLGWNDHGYGWISYDFWPHWANEVYAVQFDEKTTLSVPGASRIALKAIPVGPIGRSNGNWGYPADVVLGELKATTDKKIPLALKQFFPTVYKTDQ